MVETRRITRQRKLEKELIQTKFLNEIMKDLLNYKGNNPKVIKTHFAENDHLKFFFGEFKVLREQFCKNLNINSPKKIACHYSTFNIILSELHKVTSIGNVILPRQEDLETVVKNWDPQYFETIPVPPSLLNGTNIEKIEHLLGIVDYTAVQVYSNYINLGMQILPA